MSTPLQNINVDDLGSITLALEAMKNHPAPAPVAEPGVVQGQEFASDPVPQPDSNGEFASPLDGALFMALAHHKRQLPLNGKIAFLKEWEKNASADPEQIRKWAANYPGCNFGSVADNGPIFEVDSPAVRQRFSGSFSNTLTVASSEGKGHRYYLPANVEHIAQNATKHGDFSLRKHNAYCVSPGSIHPQTGKQYSVAIDLPMAVPTEQEIAFWNSERVEKKNIAPAGIDEPIPVGQRNSTLTSILGKARQNSGADYEVLIALAHQHNQRCTPRLPDSELETIAHSVARYDVKVAGPVVMGGISLGQPQAATVADDLSWLDLSEAAARPVFPDWAMKGTSLYDGLAKPVSNVNSKFPELIWLPAVQVMMNYLHNKVGIKDMRMHTNMFLGIISSPGKFFKSSSCKLAHEYFGHMGLVKNLTPALRNADRKVVIGQAGSSEGFGLQMSRVGATNGILFNGELGKLVSKAGIENSSLPHDLLLWYESEDYSNLIKSTKQSFGFPAGTYCFGWQFCTTVRGFNSQWPRIAGIASGMADRFFFLITPEEPKELKGEIFVNTVESSVKTKKLIDKALDGYGASTDGTVNLHEYEIDEEAADKLLKRSAAFGDPRSMNMVYKFALYFAIDLGLDSISDDCIDRALALVDYRQKAIQFLQPIEAANDEGRVLQEMIRELRQNGGKMTRREFAKNLNASYYGDRFWNTVYYGAIKADRFREFMEPGARGQTRKMIGLVKDDVRFGPE